MVNLINLWISENIIETDKVKVSAKAYKMSNFLKIIEPLEIKENRKLFGSNSIKFVNF